MKLQLAWRCIIAIKKQLSDFILTPDELLAKRKRLSVNEVAYILNVSPRHVRELIHKGVLPRSSLAPIRVPADEVKKLLQDIDFWEAAGEAELDGKAAELEKRNLQK